MKSQLILKKFSWLLAAVFVVSMLVTACRSNSEHPKEHPKEHPTTNAPAKKP